MDGTEKGWREFMLSGSNLLEFIPSQGYGEMVSSVREINCAVLKKTLYAYCKDRKAMKYRLILADPPWQYSNANLNGCAEAHYDTTNTSDLATMPVPQIADESGSVLLMWVTGPMVPDALRLFDAWGFDVQVKARSGLKQQMTAWTFGKPSRITALDSGLGGILKMFGLVSRVRSRSSANLP